MRRRSFLKAVGCAIASAWLPVAPSFGVDSKPDPARVVDIVTLIRERRDAALRAMADNVERAFWGEPKYKAGGGSDGFGIGQWLTPKTTISLSNA